MMATRLCTFAAAAIPPMADRPTRPHRFRDTFAVELLLAGVPLERVSMLLGHTTVKVTRKHYSPRMALRQQQLENDVKLTWETGLVFGKGTLQVQGKVERPN
jgi:integrase